jgi:hypothetical protein
MPGIGRSCLPSSPAPIGEHRNRPPLAAPVGGHHEQTQPFSVLTTASGTKTRRHVLIFRIPRQVPSSRKPMRAPRPSRVEIGQGWRNESVSQRGRQDALRTGFHTWAFQSSGSQPKTRNAHKCVYGPRTEKKAFVLDTSCFCRGATFQASRERRRVQRACNGRRTMGSRSRAVAGDRRWFGCP